MNNIIEEIGPLAGGSQLRRIYQKLQTGGDKVYKEAGLNFKSSWFPVYYVLAKSRSPQSIMGITNQIAFSHITVKNIVRELEGENFVRMIVNPSDKRSKLVSLSPNGRLLLQKLEPIWEAFSLVLKDVFDAGHPDMTNILSRVNGSLENLTLDQRMKVHLDPVHEVRNAKPDEFESIGKLMVSVYSQLEGFPSPLEQAARVL